MAIRRYDRSSVLQRYRLADLFHEVVLEKQVPGVPPYVPPM
jgi:hypothetical protein